MHNRTRACAISKKTKLIVYQRDGGKCIFCHRGGLPEAHYIARSQGGLGIEQNIITACRICHDKMDNSTERKRMLKEAADYLRSCYPDWNEKDLIYNKWDKDKGRKAVEETKHSNIGTPKNIKGDKSLKDKGEPPQGFFFLEEENEQFRL